MRKILDEKFVLNKKNYITQCLIVILFMSFILISLDFVFEIPIVASLGATCFIIFTFPHKNSSQLQYIVGGYIIGIIVGYSCMVGFYLLPVISLSIWGAIAIGFSMFLMVILNFEHPPAAAIALGIVMNGLEIKSLIMIFLALTLMLSVRHLLKNKLLDLK